MILVKLVAVCRTADCGARQEYEVGLCALKVDLQTDAITFDGDGPVRVDTLPEGWEWHHFMPWLYGLQPTCPKCVKERKK